MSPRMKYSEARIVMMSGTSTPLSGQTNALLTIVDVESGPGQIGFLSAAFTVLENATNAAITIIRTNGATGNQRVSYATTTNGTAVAGTNFTSVSGTFNWPDGDNSSRTFNVPIIDDTATNANRTVGLVLSNLVGTASLGIASATLTITDNDSLVSFSLASYTVVESAGFASITLNRAGASSQVVSVNFATANGTAPTNNQIPVGWNAALENNSTNLASFIVYVSCISA